MRLKPLPAAVILPLAVVFPVLGETGFDAVFADAGQAARPAVNCGGRKILTTATEGSIHLRAEDGMLPGAAGR